MDKFERQFEHLDVQTQTMEEAMSGVTTLTVPEVCSNQDMIMHNILIFNHQDQVESLMQQSADEAG